MFYSLCRKACPLCILQHPPEGMCHVTQSRVLYSALCKHNVCQVSGTNAHCSQFFPAVYQDSNSCCFFPLCCPFRTFIHFVRNSKFDAEGGVLLMVLGLPQKCAVFQDCIRFCLAFYTCSELWFMDEVLVRSNDAVYSLFVLAGQASCRTFL